MQTIILKCRPNAQFHFGRITLGEDATNLDDTSDYLHSDTLFSAIINTAAMLYDKDDVDDFIKHFKNGNLTISSAFYCLEIGEKWIYFLPKPVTCSLLETPKENHKKYKKVAFISQKVWQKGIEPKDWNSECIFIQDRFLIHKDELQEYKTDEIEKLQIFSKIALPKVKVNTQNPNDRLYNQTNISIADNKPFKKGKEKVVPKVHFYFLVKEKNNDYETEHYKKLKLIVEILADSGIGGERSIGCGKLEGIEIKNSFFENQEFESNGFAALSLVIPKDEKEFDTIEYYDLITRGGRATGIKLIKKDENGNDKEEQERLCRIKMLKEGAVLKTEIIGKTHKINPKTNKNPFLRNGLCFSLPLHKNYYQAHERKDK